MDIFNNSKYFQDFKDKKLYWIYLVENDPLKDELLPDSIKNEYEAEINEIYNLKDNENLNKNNENSNIDKNLKNTENNDNNPKNSISVNNSTIISITNPNINTMISDTKRTNNKYKTDDEYLQYLLDNKGFNKGMFTLHPELENANNNLYDTENSGDNHIYNMEEESASKSNSKNESVTSSSLSS